MNFLQLFRSSFVVTLGLIGVGCSFYSGSPNGEFRSLTSAELNQFSNFQQDDIDIENVNKNGYSVGLVVATTFKDNPSHEAEAMAFGEKVNEYIDDLTESFGVSESDLGVSTPLVAYIKADEMDSHAYYEGLVISAPRPSLMLHEFVHTFQRRLTKEEIAGANDQFVHEWFEEGLAVYISGQPLANTESTVKSLLGLFGSDQNNNPLEYTECNKSGGCVSLGAYPLYGLAVEYLFSEKGAGNSFAKLGQTFKDIGDGARPSSFGQALEDNGFSFGRFSDFNDFQKNFYIGRMEYKDYLKK